MSNKTKLKIKQMQKKLPKKIIPIENLDKEHAEKWTDEDNRDWLIFQHHID